MPTITYCRQVVCLDAAHLKGLWNGVMFVLTAKDSNNNMVLVATALSSNKECERGYKFLLETALENLEFKAFLSSPDTTIFVDGHKGSTAALKEVLPDTPWRRCVQHLLTAPGMKKMGKVCVPDGLAGNPNSLLRETSTSQWYTAHALITAVHYARI